MSGTQFISRSLISEKNCLGAIASYGFDKKKQQLVRTIIRW